MHRIMREETPKSSLKKINHEELEMEEQIRKEVERTRKTPLP